MKLDDINALVDALRMSDRERKRLFGQADCFETTVSVPSASIMCEVATVTDSPIRRSEYNGVAFLSCRYRGYEFNCISGEVA
ncbi:MAG: hypothetical protein RR842_14335 [Gordonibacter sp.]|uniref:hypothetical protein n=1 Tax=Gordonibacter sp. TaxID=1968902 RepID=UPI002FC58456